MLWLADDTVGEVLSYSLTCLEEAKLKVQEVGHASANCHVPHGPGVVSITTERLIAEDGSAALNRHANIVKMHERRRVNRDQVNFVAQSRHSVAVAR